jgi:hypothetical protein
MSADARISLSLYAYKVKETEWFNCMIQHPNTRIMDYSDGDLDWSYVKEIEALMRSLAALPIRYKKCPFCDDTWPLEMIENREKYLDSDTCYKIKDYPTFKWSDQPIITEKNSKLKVTFGSGTWIKKSIGGTFKIENEVIEPLQKIEQLCHELGVECLYE